MTVALERIEVEHAVRSLDLARDFALAEKWGQVMRILQDVISMLYSIGLREPEIPFLGRGELRKEEALRVLNEAELSLIRGKVREALDYLVRAFVIVSHFARFKNL